MWVRDQLTRLVSLGVVPDTDFVRNGAKEINTTRTAVLSVQALIPASKAAYRTATGITQGTAVPNNASGSDGDIYFRHA
jgi:hypothetical protein